MRCSEIIFAKLHYTVSSATILSACSSLGMHVARLLLMLDVGLRSLASPDHSALSLDKDA